MFAFDKVIKAFNFFLTEEYLYEGVLEFGIQREEI